MPSRRIHLVIIDPQNDFCDLPECYRPFVVGSASERLAPALPVAGAHGDMLRIASLIRDGGAGLTDISVTLDSHHHVDIAHPTFWQRGDGGAVSPFTTIRADDVRCKRFLPRRSVALPRVLAYLEALEANGRYEHMVWPVHCEIGSWGNNVHEVVRRACNAWEEARASQVAKVVKGTNPWTEHYSAIRAEVPIDGDEDTQLNVSFIEQLKQADRILICGEAGSHCVKATTEHIVENFAVDDLGKLMLLSDCMSPVAGFEPQHAEFISHMRQRGVEVARAGDFLPELLRNSLD
jgi:nicotinamidase-related amidase